MYYVHEQFFVVVQYMNNSLCNNSVVSNEGHKAHRASKQL